MCVCISKYLIQIDVCRQELLQMKVDDKEKRNASLRLYGNKMYVREFACKIKERLATMLADPGVFVGMDLI